MLWFAGFTCLAKNQSDVFIFVLRKKGGKTKKRMKDEERERKAIVGRQPEKTFFFFFFFEIFLDLNQVVLNHLADSQTR